MMNKKLLGVAVGAAGFGGLVVAEVVPINYDTLASLAEPIAIEVGDVTIQLRGLLDMPVTFDLDDDDDEDTGDVDLRGNIEIAAETQLANRWTVGVAYFGQYDTEEPLESLLFDQPEEDAYRDNAAVFVGGAWGTVTAGNVSGLVREETRRARPVGNAELAFDGLRGRLSDTGGGYIGRFGPTRVSAVVDEDGDFEVGGTFQRPIGNKDHRMTARYAQGSTEAHDGITRIDTKGAEAVVETVYGSTLVDFATGFQQLEAAADSADRWYTSASARRKIGMITASVEAHYGETDGQAETSAAVGAAIDIARGLSLNLGVNYQDADVDIGDLKLVDEDDTKAVISLRYSF